MRVSKKLCTNDSFKQKHICSISISALFLLAGVFAAFLAAVPPVSRVMPQATSPPSVGPRVAELPAPRIFINGTDSSQDWDNCPWVNGSGTWANPYIIHDLAIDASGTGCGINITNTRQYFRIENCTVQNAGTATWDAGISLYNVTNATLRNNTCQGNGRYGICLMGASSMNNTFIGNNCSGNMWGITIYNAYNNTVRGNNCTGNGVHGIYFNTACNNTVIENTCAGNTQYGMYIYVGSNNNTISGNNCTGNVEQGIDLTSSSNNTIIGNNCSGNPNGITIDASSLSAVSGNTCPGNAQYGIYLSNSLNITVRGNTCPGNAQDGINLYYSYNCTVSGNNCSGSINGIYLDHASNSTVSGNNCSENDIGINVLSAPRSNVSGNTCPNNGQHGISLSASNYNVVSWNTCPGNGQHGINLSSSSNNSISGNNCSGNINGIFLSSSSNNSISGNTCPINGQYGICLTNTSNNNTLLGNNCSWNVNSGITLCSSNGNFISGNNCSRNAVGIIVTFDCFFNEVCQNWIKKNPTRPIFEGNTGNNYHDNIIINMLAAAFSANCTAILPGHFITFTADTNSGIAPFSYQWDFKDGTRNSTQPNPTHPFSTAGTYLVTLTVTDADGDVSVAHLTITVYAVNVTPPSIDLTTILVFAGVAGVAYMLGFLTKAKKKAGPRT